MKAPSPIHMEPSASPPLMSLPLPPPFMPPPFGANGPMSVPFMPPPPLVNIPNIPDMRGNVCIFSCSSLPHRSFIPNQKYPNTGRLISPPPPPPDHHRFVPNDYNNDRDRYDRHRYSPEDSRYGDYPPDMYEETETDYSPPRSPEPYRRERGYRNYSPSPPPSAAGGRKKSSASKGSSSSSAYSDDWDRRTF